ncbi:MAG TPA: efflux RND transporter periplasmic adaptor subunit, partial [Pirellulales bacterium]
GTANSHLKIRSPIAGHVINKYVLEGQYVDEGTPLYDIADLSTVWIQAEVYEDDMPFLPLDQSPSGVNDDVSVVATTRAFPNEPFRGKLAFVHPHVNEATRTVTVRCQLPNPDHKLRPGMTATVSIHVPARSLQRLVASTAGRNSASLSQAGVLAVPASAVIDTGSQTIVYRQTLPGVFEGVKVELGPKMSGPGDVVFYPLLSGLHPGDQLVTSGSFLVDAETRLNPAAGSIYFGGSGGSKSGPSSVTVRPSTPDDVDAKIAAALARLSPADRREAEAQKFCPVLKGSRLGAMGVPVKLVIDGRTVFVCCPSCRDDAIENAAETLAKVAALQGQSAASKPPAKALPTAKALPPSAGDAREAKIKASLASLPPHDRKLATAQRFCAVLETSRLGAMGPPVKLVLDGQSVFVCCEGCREEALENPQATLAKLKRRQQAAAGSAGKPQ